MSATTRAIVPLALALCAAGWLAAGCLFSVDAEPEDGGVIGAGTVILASAPFAEDGIDPPGDDDDGDTDTYDFGPYCEALVECICEGLSPSQYLQCLEAIAELSESECLSILEDDYSECLPDSED